MNDYHPVSNISSNIYPRWGQVQQHTFLIQINLVLQNTLDLQYLSA